MVELNCDRCGENRFSYPANANDETPILCENCGESIGLFGDLKERIAEDVWRQRPKKH